MPPRDRCWFGAGAGDRLVSTKHERGSYTAGVRADIAQLVERNLAKVEVAGSSPVVRSEGSQPSPVEWPRGEAAACKAAYTGSNPVSTSRHHQIHPGRLAQR